MRVTEILMSSADSFTVDLDPSFIPTTTLKTMIDGVRDYDGYMCVFDARTDVPTLDGAAWTGRLQTRNGFSTFVGSGLSSILQTVDNLGRHRATVVGIAQGTTRTLTEWVDLILPWGGLTKGTVNLTGLSTTKLGWPLDLGAIEQLNAVCASCGAVWEIEPNGDVNFARRDLLYVDTPEIIVLDDPSTELGNTLRGVDGSIVGYVEDSTQRSSRTIGAGQGIGTSIGIAISGTTTVSKGLDGATLRIDRTMDASNVEDDALLATLTDANAARFVDVRRALRVDVDTIGFRRFVRPGDQIYCYSQLYDVVGADTVTFAGELMNPATLTVNRIEWGTHPEQGVWLYRPTQAQPWTDLSTYVIHANTATSLHVADGATSSDLTEIGGPKRYNTTRPPMFTKRSDTFVRNGGISWDMINTRVKR